MLSKGQVEEAALLGNETKRERAKKIRVIDKVQNLGSSDQSPFLKDKLDDVYKFYNMCFSNYMPSSINSHQDEDNSFPFKVFF